MAQNIDSVQSNIRQSGVQDELNFASLLQEDNTLKLIFSFFSEEWRWKLSNDTLEIFSINPIYKLEAVKGSEVKKSSRRGGETRKEVTDTSIAIIKFKIEPLWSANKMQEAIINNNMIELQIKNTAKRLKIEHLLDVLDNDYENMNFTDIEQKSIIRFIEERDQLEQGLVALPNYHVEHFTLFFLSSYPVKEDYEKYIPPRVTEHITKILTMFEQYAGK